MKRWISIALLGSLLAGCQFAGMGPQTGPPPEIEDLGVPGETQRPGRVERQVPFPEDEYAKLEKTGNSIITGQLYVTLPSGETVYGAGETVAIAPATSYSAEAAEAALAGKNIEKADPRARAYTHYAKTDERGYFKATGLPAGVFYVAGKVSVPGQAEPRVVINQVRLGKGQTVKVNLSR